MGAFFFMPMNNPLPWFKIELLQIADDLSDVKSLEGEGAYFRMLRHLWLHGPQPIELIKRKCQHAFNEIEHLFIDCSTSDQQVFSVKWIEGQREVAEAWRSDKRKAGLQSAVVRASKSKGKNRRSTTVEQPTSTSTLNSEKKERANEVEVVWPAWAGPQTLARWEEFKEYRWEEFKVKYKSPKTEQRAVNILAKFYTNEKQCVDALDNATGRLWRMPVDPKELAAKSNGFSGKPIEATITNREYQAGIAKARADLGIEPGGLILTEQIPEHLRKAKVID
jgi:hypothetical protein